MMRRPVLSLPSTVSASSRRPYVVLASTAPSTRLLSSSAKQQPSNGRLSSALKPKQRQTRNGAAIITQGTEDGTMKMLMSTSRGGGGGGGPPPSAATPNGLPPGGSNNNNNNSNNNKGNDNNNPAMTSNSNNTSANNSTSTSSPAILPVSPVALSFTPTYPSTVLYLKNTDRPLLPGMAHNFRSTHGETLKAVYEAFFEKRNVSVFYGNDTTVGTMAKIRGIDYFVRGVPIRVHQDYSGTVWRFVNNRTAEQITSAAANTDWAPTENEDDTPWSALMVGFDRIKLSASPIPVPPHRTPTTTTPTPPTATEGVRNATVIGYTDVVEASNEERAVELLGATKLLADTLRQVLPYYETNREIEGLLRSSLEKLNVNEMAFAAAYLMSAEARDVQQILESRDMVARAKLAVLILTRELQVQKVKVDLIVETEKSMAEYSRRHMLAETISRAKKELGGEEHDKTAVFRRRLEKFSDGETITSGTGATSKAQQLRAEKERAREKASKEEKEDKYWADQVAAGGTKLSMPIHVRTVVDEEITKLDQLEKTSSEFHVTRNYLDWLTGIPWGRTTADKLDVQHTRKILDEDHFGLEEVKNRILEFVAVSKLRGTVQGKIICLVGPPGVGKTSVGASIAKALDRRFYRFPVGGLFDTAEIKGHRRTYVGAMPGKLVQIFKQTGVTNPLVLVDEIDKVSGGRIQRGGGAADAWAALLELLDPAQNSAFLDHFLDLTVDASQVLFVCTANSTATIPAALLDRLEIIKLSGYDNAEKIEIAKRHLEPKAIKDSGLEGKSRRTLSYAALEFLTKWYARENGVRGLRQNIEKVYRKLALEYLGGIGLNSPTVLVGGESGTTTTSTTPTSGVVTTGEITVPELEKYVGKRKYTSEKVLGDTYGPGVVMGLAYTEEGGCTLYVETVAVSLLGEAQSSSPSDNNSKGNGRLVTTGQLGETMKESTMLAYSNAKRLYPKFFDSHNIDMHIPDGATPKDGPSAGIALTTALVSLAMSKVVPANVAMTGEISLTGRVLPVGGIREKVIAARRAGVTKLILPESNRADFFALPAHLKDGVQVVYVDDVKQVLKEVGLM